MRPDQDIWWATALRGQDPFNDHGDQPEYFSGSQAFREISLKVFSACAPEFIGGTRMAMLQKPLALDLPLQGRQWIEASAGTGKTFTLSLLVLRLLLETRTAAAEYPGCHFHQSGNTGTQNQNPGGR